MYGVVGVIFLSFWLVERFVDSYLVRWRTVPTMKWLLRIASSRLGVLIAMILPALIAGLVLSVVELPSILSWLILLAALIGGPFMMSFLIGRKAQGSLQQIISEDGKNPQAYDDYTKRRQNSGEAVVARATLPIMLGGFGVLMVAVLAVSALLQASSVCQSDDRETSFGGRPRHRNDHDPDSCRSLVPSRRAANTPVRKLMQKAETAVANADFQTALQLIQQAMDLLPNWETRFPAAVYFTMMGNFEDSEPLAKQVLQELLPLPPSMQKRYQSIIGITSQFWEPAVNIQERFDQAMEYLAQSSRANPNDPVPLNTSAEVILTRNGSPDEALDYLNRAATVYQKGKQQLHPLIWASAPGYQHKGENAEALLQEMFQTANRQSIMLANAYLDLGRVRLIQGNHNEARDAFHQAIAINSNGLIGHQARAMAATIDPS